ncbi:hypothetical protein TNCV_4266961 [Trichonephila clavipes]|nr:hypothetical protein TNCV_4266961 [Trichonephila clavipes]
MRYRNSPPLRVEASGNEDGGNENETEVTSRGREGKGAGRGRKAQNAFEKHQNALRRKNAADFFSQPAWVLDRMN